MPPGGGAVVILDNAHFAQYIPGAGNVDKDITAIVLFYVNFDGPAQNQIDGSAGLRCGKEGFPRFHRPVMP